MVQSAYWKLIEYSKGMRDEKLRKELMEFVTATKTQETYSVELNPAGNISVPANFTIWGDEPTVDMAENDDDSPKSGNNLEKKPPMDLEKNKLKMVLNFRHPVKNYGSTIIMKNSDSSDIRLYEINITILPQVFKAIIEMKTPARMPIEQNIPVSNASEKEVKMKINFHATPGEHALTCTNHLVLKGKSTTNLPVRFAPNWKGIFEAKISMNNPNTNEAFEYLIKGEATEP
jgi:hypothetical protein